MKRWINGKRYDTDKATRVGCWGNNRSDYYHCYEELYRKRTGEFFLQGTGGPNTKYAESLDGNLRTGGSRIKPLTYEEARAWAEEKLEADEYAELFEPVPEDESREIVQMKFYLTAGTANAFRRMSQETGITPSALAEKLLSDALGAGYK